MSYTLLIKNVRIVNENRVFSGSVGIKDSYITEVLDQPFPSTKDYDQVINGQERFLLPGAIDDQVHFREPGLTHKAEIFTESKAAVAGGVTSFMEMPNTKPKAITQELLEDKYRLAEKKSMANFSFYMGTTNDNIEEILKTDPSRVCGVKIFMGASTGNMLVDNKKTLSRIFKDSPLLIATHCEDEPTIRANTQWARNKYGENPPFSLHPVIRSAEACYKSSSLAVDLAQKYKSRLHVLHISTARELELFDNTIPSEEKNITSEVCIHHLWFNDNDYHEKQSLIKWNPAIKTPEDQEALLNGLLSDKLDVVATDHAPHTWDEKNNTYFNAPSGGPMIQHSLYAMLELHRQGKIRISKIVEKMSHTPARIFQIKQRGFIRKGYKADLVLVDTKKSWKVSRDNILYKAGWSPLDGYEFHSGIDMTIINGQIVYNEGHFDESFRGERLLFER
ncbi:MAG: dihydroorotase [Bacteroidales bacterium]|nr:dihydroorotase [Bacteroidales bacterium]MCF8333256.1 dihydroorotase [Bacteroidales bacterium]